MEAEIKISPMAVLFKGLKTGNIEHILKNESVYLLAEKREICDAFDEGKLDASIGEYQSAKMFFCGNL